MFIEFFIEQKKSISHHSQVISEEVMLSVEPTFVWFWINTVMILLEKYFPNEQVYFSSTSLIFWHSMDH